MSIETFLNSATPPTQYTMHPSHASPGLYDGTSEESSPSSPSHGMQRYDQLYSSSGYYGVPQFPYVYHEAEYLQGSIEAVPLEFNIDGLYDETDRRRRRNPKDKNVSSQVHSRRRAQNRASQRAFRDRKEKHVKELEHRLQDLEEKHSSLSQSHELLQHEYDSAKKQLARLVQENESLRDPSSSSAANVLTPEESFDPGKGGDMLFNEPFFFDSADAGLSKE